MSSWFSDTERETIYRIIHARRDMRHLNGGTVSPDILQRMCARAGYGKKQLQMQLMQGSNDAR